jgi:signal peptidase I
VDNEVKTEDQDGVIEAPDAAESQAPEAPAERRHWIKHRSVRWVSEWVVIIACALLVALLMRAFAFETFFIPSSSMVPTLQIGDRIIVSKLSVEWGTINRGDILVFRRPPAENCGGEQVNDLVKRVIGLPGDHLWSVGNSIYYSTPSDHKAQLLHETWTHTEPLGIAIPDSPGKTYFVVPKNSYYMMGDNHSYSCDSRYWGPIKRSYVVGKVFLRVWPLSRFGFL